MSPKSNGGKRYPISVSAKRNCALLSSVENEKNVLDYNIRKQGIAVQLV